MIFGCHPWSRLGATGFSGCALNVEAQTGGEWVKGIDAPIVELRGLLDQIPADRTVHGFSCHQMATRNSPILLGHHPRQLRTLDHIAPTSMSPMTNNDTPNQKSPPLILQ